MSASAMKINLKRLKSLVNQANTFGADDQTGGYNRLGYSPEDMSCRKWFEDEMRRTGLSVRRDSVANVFGRLGPVSGPCFMTGSHLDTVVNGGAFDGVLGACAALECVLTMIDAGFIPTTAIEVVATAEEEGRFGGMLGSQAIVGDVKAGWAETAVDARGIRLTDAMAKAGLSAKDIPLARRQPGELAGFLELHIEQGPVLEADKCPIGIAENVSGVCYLEITFDGTANHSGTTPMHLRQDAFVGLAQLSTTIQDIIRRAGTNQSRITIGSVELTPNDPHTIPGKAVFSVIIRDTLQEVMTNLRNMVEETAQSIAKKNGLTATVQLRSWINPTNLDVILADQLAATAEEMDLPYMKMASGAGHDAQTFQKACPSGLIFIPSKNGISHAPEEDSDWNEIEKGANLLLQTLAKLSSQPIQD